MSPLVSGFFWDDYWPTSAADADARGSWLAGTGRRRGVGAGSSSGSGSGRFPDSRPNVTEDIGLTQADFTQISTAYNANMGALRTATLAAGKFSWQMLWTGGSSATGKGSTVPRPVVTRDGCAPQLRALCGADSPAQTRAMMYAFDTPRGDPSKLPSFDQDLANFLLIRGPYAWLGHGGWVV